MAGKEMRTHNRVDPPSVVSAYDWGALGYVVDVGGGDGTLLIALLNEYPALSGTVVDLPATAETARRMLAAAGLSDRANAVAADFLAELPPDAEGYLLSAVLHEWNDDDARAILRNCATAAGEDGAIFVIEPTTDSTLTTTITDASLRLTGASRGDLLRVGGASSGALTTSTTEDGALRDGATTPHRSPNRGVPELTALAESAGLVVAAVHTAGTASIVELVAR